MSEPKYCSLLWAHMSNEPLGQVRTCCIAKERVKDDNGEDFTLGSTSVRDIFHSNYYKKIRQEIREGKLPDNCEPCWREEANGKKSKRQIYNEYAEWRLDPIDYSVEPDMPQDMQIILSTTCNLKCRSCNPNYSSKWVKEANARGLPYFKEVVPIPMDDQERSKYWTKMDDWIPHIKNLEIMGGEPLYMKEFKTFAEKLIDQGYAKNIGINFSTNGTQAGGEFLERVIENFNNVAFNVSIDGIGKRFEYLRFPGKWEEVSANLDKIHNWVEEGKIHAGITNTVTILNLMYLPEFHKEFRERWPRFDIFHNIANLPSWFNPNVLPDHMKERSVSELQKAIREGAFDQKYVSEMKGILRHATARQKDTVTAYGEGESNTIESEIAVRWNMFRKQVVSGDQYRKEDFREVFPELWNIVKEDFDYDLLYTRAETDPMYGAIEKGTYI